MKLIKFILEKIVIVEVMLIILFFIKNLFGISFPIIDTIINTGLTYLTPIAIISLILYVIVSLISSKIIEVALGVVIGGIILYYLFTYII